MDQSGTGYATELRYAIVQKRKKDGSAESVIARFQHESLANEFMKLIVPVDDHYLYLQELHG